MRLNMTHLRGSTRFGYLISVHRGSWFFMIKKRKFLSRTKTTVCGPCNCPPIHVDNGLKFGLRPSIRFGRWTKIIILRWTSGRILDHGPSDSRTDSDDSLGVKFYSWFWAFERIFQRWNIKWTVLVDHSNSIWGRPLSSERWKVYCWKDLNQLWNFGLFRKMTGSKSEVNWNFPKVFKNVFVSPLSTKNFLRLKYSRAGSKNIQQWSKNFILISPCTDITDLYQGSTDLT